MTYTSLMDGRKIDKKHVATVIIFAIKYIPNTDAATLYKFLELVNTTGSFGWTTEAQLLAEMKFMARRVPHTCRDSLLTVIELLDVCVPLDLESRRMAQITAGNQPAVMNLPQSALLEMFI
ncbi:MAG: hypothetical protein JXM69_01670 [Anaerolineae bacterium]|nr:hypothetical protein [Anaerolineae bacterium]